MKKGLLLAAILMSSVASAQASEAILGYSANMKGVTFQVPSGGCTSKESFKVKSVESDVIKVSLVRVKQDFCEAYFPFGTEVFYTWAELGLENRDRFVVANPNGVLPVLAE